MADSNWQEAALSPGARKFVESVLRANGEIEATEVDISVWLIEALSKYPGMAGDMLASRDPSELLAELRKNEPPRKKRMTGAAEVVDRARSSAEARGRDTIAERDLVAGLLVLAGYQVLEGAGAGDSVAAKQANGSAGTTSTTTLERYGRDLTTEAAAGRLFELIGRDREVETVIEVLCRSTKRNPVLIGPAGTGKTTIAEGLAQRIVSGEVPEMLRASRLMTIDLSSLVAGSGVVGEFEKRVEQIIREASQPNVIVFIDEMHAITGAGGRPGSGDFGTLLKPALARGDIACIAATTQDEYRQYIEPDAALERRFSPVYVEELSPEATLQVLESRAEFLCGLRGVEIESTLLPWIVDFAADFMRSRTFPDKAVDLLEQCVAHAVAAGSRKVSQEDAIEVTSRMVGLPRSAKDALEVLEHRIGEVLPSPAAEETLARLRTTLLALDVQSGRPNLVLLLGGRNAATSYEASELLADALFASPDRIVCIDVGSMQEEHQLSQLLGSSAGYVGYDDAIAIHQLARTPWCVLTLEGIDRCHPAIVSVIADALRSGAIRDARGRQYFLSDAVVVMSAPSLGADSSHRDIGFIATSEPEGAGSPRQEDLVAALGARLVEQVDVWCVDQRPAAAEEQAYGSDRLLKSLGERYARRGVRLVWDDSILNWLSSEQDGEPRKTRIERHAEELLAQQVAPLLAKASTSGLLTVRLRYSDGALSAGLSESEGEKK